MKNIFRFLNFFITTLKPSLVCSELAVFCIYDKIVVDEIQAKTKSRFNFNSNWKLGRFKTATDADILISIFL